MVFSSITFLIYFLPIFLICYQFLRTNQSKNIWILIASIFFYAWGAPKFVFILVASTIIDFHLVKTMHLTASKVLRKRLLSCSIILNLGLLAYFKYANFFVENVQLLFPNFQWINVILPIGISFYTFQTLTYSIDIYRGNAKPLEKVTDYLLYIMMFPQLIAGPIVRYNHIADQIRGRVENYDVKVHGFFRFSLGLAKKVLIANSLGQIIDPFFLDIESLDAATAWIIIVAYSFQIYFDFSGYSDMAIGLGKMMGFQFPENFNSPYISKSITEFWRRWHITLGDWMRDYLYIPLGGNRVNSSTRLYFNLSFVFLMSGLWHGASWNFVLWGIFHGLFLILDRLFLLQLLKKLFAPVSIILTFFVVVLSWVIFRIEEFSDAMIFYRILFNFQSWQWPDIFGGFWLSLFIAILISFSTYFRCFKKLETYILSPSEKQNSTLLFLGVAITLFIICIIKLCASDFNPFIYFRF